MHSVSRKLSQSQRPVAVAQFCPSLSSHLPTSSFAFHSPPQHLSRRQTIHITLLYYIPSPPLLRCPNQLPNPLPRPKSLVRPFNAILDKRRFSYMYVQNYPFKALSLTFFAISCALWRHWVRPQPVLSLVSLLHGHATFTDSIAISGT